jgi:endonuclease/exonuclease/phosphatase family metal-dependent hydrolase
MLASLYKSPVHALSDADITELLSFRGRTILAGDLNAKHPFWNSAVSKPSDEKPMTLFDFCEYVISAPQCPTNYSPAGNGDVLDIVVHQNIRVSDFIVSHILDSDHLPILYHKMDSENLGILQNLFKNLQIVIGFKASPRD